MTDPMIPCEGTDCSTHQHHHGDPPDVIVGMCAMCGQAVPLHDDGTATAHDRRDILAMIDRGDFDD